MKFQNKTVVILCVLVLSLSYVASQKCNGGVQCIALQQCSGLYQQLQQGNSPQLTQLLRTLHCGFDENSNPMICCPPQFQNDQTPSPNINSRNDGASILPNSRVCGIQNADKVVGGTQADIDEHPWMALLRYDKPRGWGFYCGGVLISSRYILTAAHCVKGSDLPSNWNLAEVRLGEWNTSSEVDCINLDCSGPVQDVPIEQIIAHESYDPLDKDQHNDIALLRLTRHVVFNDFVKPICLPLSDELKRATFDGLTMEVAGWGKTETQENEDYKSSKSQRALSGSESDVKLKVKVPVVTRSKCAQTFRNVDRNIVSTQMCAGGRSGQDSCRGDSGGSLMGTVDTASNWFAFGVVSYGPSPCGTPGWPGVYTRVGAYVDWILSKLQP